MKAAVLPTTRRLLLSGGFALCLTRLGFGQTPPAAGQASWPHTVSGRGGSATIFEPQAISWPGQTTLNARAAMSIARQGSSAPILGTVEVTADTSTDFATRTVILSNLRLTASHFPSLDTSQAAQLEARIKAVMPDVAFKRVPLDTVLLSLREAVEPGDDPAVSNEPPTILYSARPASLVVFDGDPILAPITGSTLSFVVNTNWDLFFDPAGEGNWYLLNNGSWFHAPKATGPYQPAEALPEALRALPDEPNLAEARRAIPGRTLAPDSVPTIFVSTKPAEIIVTDGPPAYSKIPETQLQYVINSNSTLFRHEPTGRFYYLVSGRWFSAASLEGPWSFATPDLPPDFGLIPPSSPAGSVLSSVPGTAQAQEAVLQAQIPRQATLNRSAAKLEVAYIGQPKFEPIPGTGIAYAVNTTYEVLEITGKYYCCHQGAWFVAPKPTGPWILATSVPPGIHRIPPSRPLHNVTYVSVYASTPTTVTYGYTAGYLGGLVTAGVLVYGTGYYYPPVVMPGPVPVYMPYPYTYAGNVYYNPTSGAWARGGTVYGPYGGAATGGTAYNPTTGAWARGGAVYGPYGGAGAWSAYNPTTGAYAHGSAAWGPDGGTAHGDFYNPRTGISGSTTQNSNPYERWGSSTVSGPNQTVNTESGRNAQGTAGAFRSSTGAEGAGVHGVGGNNAGAVRTQSGNVYAGADGNVYRHTNDGWSKWNNGSWQTVQPPNRDTGGNPGRQQGSPAPSRTGLSSAGTQTPTRQGTAPRASERSGSENQNFNQLEQDHQARQFGEMRQRSFGEGGGWGASESGLRSFGGGEGRFGAGGLGGFRRR
jgi:hypothetical protein